MAICCVSEIIQTAHQPDTLRALDFFASLHLTIFEQAANFEFSRQSAMRRTSRLFFAFIPPRDPAVPVK